jgi:hypothetical protein
MKNCLLEYLLYLSEITIEFYVFIFRNLWWLITAFLIGAVISLVITIIKGY